MRARTRPLALEGRSGDAAISQNESRISAVQAAILDIFRASGPLTADALEDAYAESVRRASAPPASPQSVRSRAAELKHRGILRVSDLEGRSRYGRPATVLALAEATHEVGQLW